MSTEETDQPENGDEEEDEDIQYFVRIGQTDLDGTVSVERALLGMNGIGRRAARHIAAAAGVSRTATFGRLDEATIDEIVSLVTGFAEEVPDWMANRPTDFYTGETEHIVGNDLELSRQQDVNRMQMIDSYKGVRHQRGQKVRGQRTRSTGRSEGTVGVNVEAIQEQFEEEEEA
ncbi:30S ribosomal protein S13 [Halobacteriales archaeon QH_6_64_20]|jgi:small subunit ribosomal protein S13|nr:MAG: 30S ribosomal protein S13 [Halobacteriales archaeon QH_6_64_20]